METRLTLRPGQNGTKKLVERYGERLVRVRYLYDPQARRRLKTVELIVESVAWHPRSRHPRRRDLRTRRLANHPSPDIRRHMSPSISRWLHPPMDASSMPRMSFNQ
jgi:hypothetical protein